MRLKLHIFLFLVLLLPLNSLGADVLQVNTSIKPPFSTVGEDGFFDLLIKELFKRTGNQVEFVRLPAERALKMVNDGHSDAEVPRIGGLSRLYPNLIVVEEPVLDYHFVAFSRDDEMAEGLEWEKLGGRKVGMIIGWKIYENNVPESAILVRVASPAQLFKLLDGGRIDIALYEKFAGRRIIRDNEYQGIRECAPALAVRPMYLYMHKKHAGLAVKLMEELIKMKADGSWEQIVSATLE